MTEIAKRYGTLSPGRGWGIHLQTGNWEICCKKKGIKDVCEYNNLEHVEVKSVLLKGGGCFDL